MRGSVSVRDAGGIAEIDIIFVGQDLSNGVEDGESSDSAVEDADGLLGDGGMRSSFFVIIYKSESERVYI